MRTLLPRVVAGLPPNLGNSERKLNCGGGARFASFVDGVGTGADEERARFNGLTLGWVLDGEFPGSERILILRVPCDSERILILRVPCGASDSALLSAVVRVPC